MPTLTDEIRSFWDEDAATYDLSAHHRPASPAVHAAWLAALARALPARPAHVLDCGAGTGFLSLMAARLGHRVTAVDVSPAMLDRLRAAACRAGLEIDAVEGRVEEPPNAGFDAVMERHVLWTLPDPARALQSWRRAAPAGTLVLVESLSGHVDPLERVRARVRTALRKLRRGIPDHHAEYSASVRAQLPLASGAHPDQLVEMVETAGWRSPRLHRLRDVEWMERLTLAWPECLVGLSPRFMLVAPSSTP
jgi:ubiquinone/menaquinone biosynthesis C-methylase UbiE